MHRHRQTRRPMDPIAFEKLRKTFKRSRLSLTPGTHSGLGLSAYTQASSPIRRYADLVTQQQFTAFLQGKPVPYDREELLRILANAETTEQEIRAIEDRSTNYWILEYLSREKIGQPMNAVVLDRKGNIELEECYLRGRLQSPGGDEPGRVISVLIDTIQTGQRRGPFQAGMNKMPTPKSQKKSGGEISVGESVDILSKAIAGFDFLVDADDFILYELNRMIEEERASFEDEEFRILIDEGIREHVEENLQVRARLTGELRIAARAVDPATRSVAERVIRALENTLYDLRNAGIVVRTYTAYLFERLQSLGDIGPGEAEARAMIESWKAGGIPAARLIEDLQKDWPAGARPHRRAPDSIHRKTERWRRRHLRCFRTFAPLSARACLRMRFRNRCWMKTSKRGHTRRFDRSGRWLGATCFTACIRMRMKIFRFDGFSY